MHPRCCSPRSVANFDGEFFQLRDARCEPKPVQARLPLWIGGGGEKVTLRIVARHADGWNVPFVAPDVYAHKVAGARTSTASAVGRDPADDRRKRVNLALAWNDEDLEAQFGGMARPCVRACSSGSVQEMVDRIGEYADAGVRAGDPRAACAVRPRRPRPLRRRGPPAFR